MATGAIAAGTVAGGALSYLGSKKASGAQQAAAQQAAAANKDAAKAQMEMFRQTRKDLAPYRQAGTTGLTRYQDLLYGKPIKDAAGNVAGYEKPDYSLFTESPGYQFRVDEGQRALERSAAAKGSLQSGATLKALTKYGQGVAGQQYDQYLNRLQGLAQSGQNAATQTGSFGQAAAGQYGNMMGRSAQNLQDIGTARASGYAGQAQALGSTLSNLAGMSSYLGQGGQFGFSSPQRYGGS